jgi:hypothetical protein
MTKPQVIAELKAAGITFDESLSVKELEKLLPKKPEQVVFTSVEPTPEWKDAPEGIMAVMPSDQTGVIKSEDLDYKVSSSGKKWLVCTSNGWYLSVPTMRSKGVLGDNDRIIANRVITAKAGDYSVVKAQA